MCPGLKWWEYGATKRLQRLVMEEEGKEYKVECFVYNFYPHYSLERGRSLSFLECGWKSKWKALWVRSDQDTAKLFSKLSEAVTLQITFLLGLSFPAVKRQFVSWKLKGGCYLVWALINKHWGVGCSRQDNSLWKAEITMSQCWECVISQEPYPLVLKTLPSLNSSWVWKFDISKIPVDTKHS